MVQMGLAARGIEVLPAADLERARELCDAGVVDAAFVDLSPIETDPAAALELLRQHNGRLPVILISGSANVPSHQLELSAWVRKPFEISELCEALSEVVSR
jgi:DNA-binding response OmpR family regulator